MAFPSWQSTIQNDNGDIIPSADMSILLESTGLDATIFSDRLGTTPISVPRTTDVNGFFQFYAAPGEYRITASDSGSGFSQTWRYVVLTGDSAQLTKKTSVADTTAERVVTSNDYQPVSGDGLGIVRFMKNVSGGNILNGASISASSLNFCSGNSGGDFIGSVAAAPTGTWVNVTGITIADVSFGLFVRTV